MHYALGAYVHPTACGHLSVVGHAQLHAAVPFILVVENSDQEPVGDYYSRGFRTGLEESQRMSAFDDERRILCQFLQVLFDQSVLQPVLANLARLSIGHELIGIKGNLEVKVIVDHYLEGLARQALALVLVYGFAVNPPFGPVSVGIDPARGLQLFHELGGKFLVEFLRHVPQGVFKSQFGLFFVQRPPPVRCPADAFCEFWIFRQFSVEFYGHGLAV